MRRQFEQRRDNALDQAYLGKGIDLEDLGRTLGRETLAREDVEGTGGGKAAAASTLGTTSELTSVGADQVTPPSVDSQ